MEIFSKEKQNSHAKKKDELKIPGRAVSRGVANGIVVCLYGKKRQFYRINLSETQIKCANPYAFFASRLRDFPVMFDLCSFARKIPVLVK